MPAIRNTLFDTADKQCLHKTFLETIEIDEKGPQLAFLDFSAIAVGSLLVVARKNLTIL